MEHQHLTETERKNISAINRLDLDHLKEKNIIERLQIKNKNPDPNIRPEEA
jgi:hypothetical protein